MPNWNQNSLWFYGTDPVFVLQKKKKMWNCTSVFCFSSVGVPTSTIFWCPFNVWIYGQPPNASTEHIFFMINPFISEHLFWEPWPVTERWCQNFFFFFSQSGNISHQSAIKHEAVGLFTPVGKITVCNTYIQTRNSEVIGWADRF